MVSIILLLLLGVLILLLLLVQQQRKTHLLKETLHTLKEAQEIKGIRAKLEGRDEERKRITRDWHDGIGNSLSTLKLIVDTIQPQNPNRHTEALNLLEDLQLEFRQIIDTEKVSLFADEVKVKATLKKWQERLQLGNIKLIFKVCNFISYDKVNIVFKSHLYRIVQELVHNSIKHGEASRIEVTLKEQKSRMEVLVKDNGKGIAGDFQEKELLTSVRERLYLLDGKIIIEKNYKEGTIISINLPF